MSLVHGSNLKQKEEHRSKYTDPESKRLLAEIRDEYNRWRDENAALKGPGITADAKDAEIIERRVASFERYKTFIDQQKYAEAFDSRSNLHSSVLEEFLFYLFRDLVAGFGDKAMVGKSHAFKDVFFVPPNYRGMLERPFASVEEKDHDFVIGTSVEARLSTVRPVDPPSETPPARDEVRDPAADPYLPRVIGSEEVHRFDIPAVAIECKTYLDKTMLEGSSRAADELKARNPNAIYLVVMEWLKLTDAVNLRKYKVDQIYVLRRQKNTDREFRFEAGYVKNPVAVEVVLHLYETVRAHLAADWQGGAASWLERGWLL